MSTSITATLSALTKLSQELDDLRVECADNDVIYDIYAQSIKFRQDILKEQLRKLEYFEEADLWIGLQGSAFDEHSGPIDILSKFLSKFHSATRHAVATLLNKEDTGGRFGRHIEDLTQFDFVGTAPGSLRIGLKQKINLVEDLNMDLENPVFGDSQMLQIADSSEKLEKALELLMMAFSEDGDGIDKIRDMVGESGALRILYHAREMLVNGVDAFEFSGHKIGSSKLVPFSRKGELKQIGEQLVDRELYVRGGGVFKMMDLRNLKVGLEDVVVDEMGAFKQMDCDVSSFDYDKLKDRALWDQWAWFTGRLIFDQKGKPTKIALDTLSASSANADI